MSFIPDPKYARELTNEEANIVKGQAIPEGFNINKSETEPTGGFGTGILKGLGTTAFNIAKAGEKIADITGLNKAVDTIARKLGFSEEFISQQRIREKPEFLETKTPTEKVGFAIEQLGEFFIPFGGQTKALSLAPKVGKLAKLGLRSLGEAVEFAFKSATQTGDIEAGLEGGIIGGLTPPTISLVGKAISPIKEYLSQKAAPGIINALIRPINNAFRFGRDPGKAIVEEKIVGNTREQLLKNVVSTKESIGKEIEAVLTQKEVSQKIIETEKLITEPIDAALKDAVDRGEQELVNRLTNLRDGLTKEFKLVEGKLAFTGKLKNTSLSPKDTQLLKRQVGEATRWTGQAFDNDINQVRVQIYRNLDNAIDAATPGIEKLNSRYANMLTAEKSLERELANQARRQILGLTEIGVGVATLVGGIATGGLDVEDLIRTAGAVAAVKGLRSPAFQTRLASQLGKLNPEEQQLMKGVLTFVRNLYISLEE